ncbi:MAG: hypothetical protein H7832_06405 [Magnetococcus sp. DMHC-6]
MQSPKVLFLIFLSERLPGIHPMPQTQTTIYGFAVNPQRAAKIIRDNTPTDEKILGVFVGKMLERQVPWQVDYLLCTNRRYLIAQIENHTEIIISIPYGNIVDFETYEIESENNNAAMRIKTAQTTFNFIKLKKSNMDDILRFALERIGEQYISTGETQKAPLAGHEELILPKKSVKKNDFKQNIAQWFTKIRTLRLK